MRVCCACLRMCVCVVVVKCRRLYILKRLQRLKENVVDSLCDMKLDIGPPCDVIHIHVTYDSFNESARPNQSCMFPYM